MTQEDPELTFVRTMKTLRVRRKLSQEGLAREVEARTGLRMNPTAITKLEWALDPVKVSQARGLRLREALAIATVLGSTVPRMAAGDDAEVEQPEAAAVENVKSAEQELAEIDAVRRLAEIRLEEARKALTTVSASVPTSWKVRSHGEHPAET